MNKVILMGRLTRDPEIRYTQTKNTLVASFTLAINRRFAKENEKQTDFINIVAWSKTGEFVSKYFKKGQQVNVVGRLQVRDYQDKDGKTRYITEVVAEEVYFADSKKENSNTPEFENYFGTSGINANIFESMEDDDDLPF